MRVAWVSSFDEVNPGTNPLVSISLKAVKDRSDFSIEVVKLQRFRTLKGFLNSVKILWQLPKYDAVHCQYGSISALVTCIFARRQKVIITLRGSDLAPWTSILRLFSIRLLIARVASTFAVMLCNTVICVSQRMRKMISWKKSVVVLPTPIDHEFWRSVTCSPQRDSEGPFTIGCVTISPSNAIKQIDFLEKCVSTASLMTNKELRFEVATDLTKTELREFYSRVDLLVCGSLHEGWPNFVKEGLAAGKRFVSTDVSDLPDVVNFNRTNCRVVSRNKNDFARAIVDLLKVPDIQETYTLSAYAKKFDLPQFSKKLAEIYAGKPLDE